MRLDFNVLWVEDQPAGVYAQRERIELALRKEGFRLSAQFAQSVAEASRLLSSDIYGDHIDLVLMDYELGEGPKGDDGLVAVREQFGYKEIIFYSSRATDLLRILAQKQVQGVYCSSRDGLVDTVVGVFEALVKKVVDIEHARGIVMGATSSIDHLVNESLVSFFDKADHAGKAGTLTVLARHMKHKRKAFDKEAACAEAVTHVSELLGLHNVYTSSDRLRLLASALELAGLHPSEVASIKAYLKDTVPKRNRLAHVKVEVNGFSRRLLHADGTEITGAEMKELRLDLLRYQERLEALATALG